MSHKEHLENLKMLEPSEVSLRIADLVATCPENSWPGGMPASIDPKLVLIGVSPGNSAMSDSSEHSDKPAFISLPSVEKNQSSHFYYPDTVGYWERLRYLCSEYFCSDESGLSVQDAISLSTHLNLGTGSAGSASVKDVEEAYVKWVSRLLNAKLNPDLVILFGLKSILSDKTVCGWWNHSKGLQINWKSPLLTIPFSGYQARTYKYRIWEAKNQVGHRFKLIVWPNHPSRVPFRDIEIWKASVSEGLEALKSRA